MRRRLQQLALFSLVSMVCVSAWAEVRVLFRFDESGHHVHSLTEAPERVSLKESARESVRITSRDAIAPESLPISERIKVASANLRPTMATLVWFDANGSWLSNSEVPDPRVAHSPAHIDGVNESLVGLDNGAWLASGPDKATAVTILFPSNALLALGSEQWHATLTKD